MDKKKLLLSTTIASAMFITGMSMSNVLAATSKNVPNVKQFATQNTYLNGESSISIELAETKKTLTREDVEKLLDERYNSKGIVKSIVNKGTTNDVAANGSVGTGATVTLQSGKTLTVVLFGDINGDGTINLQDALGAFNIANNINLDKYDIAAKRAANVGLAGRQDVSNNDALRIFNYHVGADDSIIEITTVDNKEKSNFPADEAVSTFKIATTIATSGTNAAKINPVVEGANINVYANINSMSTEATTANVQKKMAEFTLTTNKKCKLEKADSNVVIDSGKTGVTIKVASDETKEINLQAIDNEGNLTGENLKLTIKVVNLEKPVITTVEKAEVTGEDLVKNMSYVNAPAEDSETGYLNADTKDIAISAKVSLMKNYTRTVNEKEVTGNWYKLALTKSVDEELAVDGAEYENVDGKLIVWLDALKPSTTLKVRNVNAVEDQPGLFETYTVEVTSLSKLNQGDVTPTVTEDTDNNVNLGLTLNTTDKANYVLQDTNAVVATKKVLPGETEENTVAYQWYEVTLTISDKIDLTTSNVVLDNPNNKYPFVTVADKTIKVWLKLEDGDQKLVLKHTIEDNKEEQETITLNIKVVDVKTPALKANAARVANGTENANAIGAITNTAENTLANNVTDNVIELTAPAKVKAMKTSTRNGVQGKWFAMLVDTGVKREYVNLQATTENVTTDLEVIQDLSAYNITNIDGTKTEVAPTEILLWVNASADPKKPTVYTISNKNNNTIDEETGEITDYGTKALNFKVIISEQDATLTIDSAKEAAKKFDGKDVEKRDANLNLMVAKGTEKTVVNKEDIVTVKLPVNDMKAYTNQINNKEGLWYGVLVTTSLDRTLLKSASTADYIVDIEGSKSYTGIQAKEVLVWLNAANKETKVSLTGVIAEGIEETVEFTAKITDTSAPKLTKTSSVTLPTYESLGIDVNNMKYVASPKFELVDENKPATPDDASDDTLKLIVNANLKGMTAYNNGTNTAKWFGILVDTGISREDLKIKTGDNVVIGKIADASIKDTVALLWVNDATTAVELQNKNDAANTATAFTLNVKDTSKVDVGTISTTTAGVKITQQLTDGVVIVEADKSNMTANNGEYPYTISFDTGISEELVKVATENETAYKLTEGTNGVVNIELNANNEEITVKLMNNNTKEITSFLVRVVAPAPKA